MFIAIIIPVYNRVSELIELLSSIDKYCNNVSEYSVIIVDDGSDFPISENLSNYSFKFRINVLRQPNSGPASARNTGILYSRTDWVIFLDSDVIIRSDIISQINSFMQISRVSNLIGIELNIVPILPSTRELVILNESPSTPVNGGAYHTAGMVYNRNELLLCGGFDESFERAACEDVDLACRMLKRGSIVFANSIIIYHPPRVKTMLSAWKKRNHWLFARNLAVKNHILAWPSRRSDYPRFRIAISALLLTPTSRFLGYFNKIVHSREEVNCFRILSVFVVETIASWVMVPLILFSPLPRPAMISRRFNLMHRVS